MSKWLTVPLSWCQRTANSIPQDIARWTWDRRTFTNSFCHSINSRTEVEWSLKEFGSGQSQICNIHCGLTSLVFCKSVIILQDSLFDVIFIYLWTYLLIKLLFILCHNETTMFSNIRWFIYLKFTCFINVVLHLFVLSSLHIPIHQSTLKSPYMTLKHNLQIITLEC